MARFDASIATFFGVHNGLAMGSIYLGGSEEQKQKWLPAMAAGEKLGCFGLTEPDFGSNPGGMRTRAVRDGDHVSALPMGALVRFGPSNRSRNAGHQQLGKDRAHRAA